jgi:signal peptidase I
MKKILRTIGFVTVLAFGVRLLLVESFTIASESMAPGLHRGDWVLATKYDYNVHLPFSAFELVKFRRPSRGEVVVFSLPDHGIETFIKRVVGVSGDILAIKQGMVWVNGKPAAYVPALSASSSFVAELLPEAQPFKIQWEKTNREDYGPIDVPKDHFFALSDNRNDYSDSRTWGPVPYSCLAGRLKLVLAGSNSVNEHE